MEERNNGNGNRSNSSNPELPPPQQRQQLSTLHRALRTRRSSSSSSTSSNSSSSGMISSTTSPVFSAPQNVASGAGPSRAVNATSRLAASLQSSLNNSSNSSNVSNNQSAQSSNSTGGASTNAGRSSLRDALEDDGSSCQPSSSTSSPQFMSPSPRIRPAASAGSSGLSNSVASGSSSNGVGISTSQTGRSSASRNGPASPLGSPDSTIWGSAQSPMSNNYRMGPPTPGGMCVVSSSTADDVPPSPLQFASDDMGGAVSMGGNSSAAGSSSSAVNSSSNGLRTTRSNTSSSSGNQSGNSNGLILNSLINAPVLGGPPPSVPVTSSPAPSTSRSSASSNLSSSGNLESSTSGVSFNVSRSKIKKASSFERFSLLADLQAANHQSSQPSSIPQSENGVGPAIPGPSRDPPTVSLNQLSNASQTQAGRSVSNANSNSSSNSTGSKILWDSLMQSSSSGSGYRTMFTTNSGNPGGDSKSLHIKIPSKKLAAKIAIEQEEQQQMQLQQQQNEIMTNLLNQNVLNHPAGSLMNEVVNHLMNDVGGEHESLIRELSNSPLNLTDSNAGSANLSNAGSSQSLAANSSNSELRNPRSSAAATVTASTSSSMGIPSSHPSLSSSSKKIPLTPKQKLLHRMQSGELPLMTCSSPPVAQQLQHQVQNQSSSSTVQSSTLSLSFASNPQNLPELGDCIPQQQSPQPPQIENYVYDTLMRGRDDFVVQDNLNTLAKTDASDSNNVVLYDQDNYYYYGNELGDEIFCTSGTGLGTSNPGLNSGNGSSSRGPMLLLSQPVLQDGMDNLPNQQHGQVDFIIGLDEHGLSERHLREAEELDLVQAGSQQQQQFADPNDNLQSKSGSQAESTLRNLLMMGPLQSHDDTNWIADYQHQQQNNGSSGSRSIRQSSSLLPSHSSSGSMNLSVISGNLNGSSTNNVNSLQNTLNMNLGSGWMNSLGCDWQRGSWAPSLSSIGHHDGDEIQDEVMDMSIMDSPEKQQHSSKRHMDQNDDDVDLSLPLLQSMPLDLQPGLGINGLLINSKGQQVILHQGDDQGLDQDPLNLQHHHNSHSQHHRSVHIIDDDEPVNLMSAVSMEDDLNHHAQHPHHTHHIHHSHSSHHGHHPHSGQQNSHPLSEDDLQHVQPGFQLISHQQSIQLSRHSSGSHMEQNGSKQNDMQCGSYVTIHQDVSDISPSVQNGNSTDYQVQHSQNDMNVNDVTMETSQDLYQASLSSDLHNDQDQSETAETGVSIDERRIIRVKKSKDVLTAMQLATDFQVCTTKATVSASGGNIILDKPVQLKSFASLPSPLSLSRVNGNGLAVFTARYKTIPANTRFGPVEGPLKRAFKDDLTNSNAVYPCLVMVDSSNVLWQLDRTDDEICNWMKFVRMARNATESNALVIEDRGLLYFTTTKDVPPKTELQVSYSVGYAQKYGLSCYAGSGAAMLSDKPTSHIVQNTSEQMSVITQHTNIVTENSIHQTSEDDVCMVMINETDNFVTQEQPTKNTVAEHNTTPSKVCELAKETPVSYVEVYPCFECTEHFATREMLNEHLDRAHSEPEVQPKMKKRNLKKMKFLEDADSFSKANSVEDSVTTKEIRTNEEVTVKQGRHECTTCKSVLPTLVDLTKHYATHHFEQDADPAVGSSSSSHDHSFSHVRASDKDEAIARNGENVLSSTQGVSEGTGDSRVSTATAEAPAKVKCSMCYKSFASKERLDKHMIVHSDDDTKPLKCEFCPKRFLTNSALAGHIKTHAEEGKCFECPMCNFVTQQLLQLKEHVQTHRNKENGLFHCPKCSKRFTAYSMVRKHIRAFHGPRQFGCDQCTMNFPTADKLKLHKLKHSDHREFLCAECGRQFKRKDKLREHTKRMHENKKKPQLEIQTYAGPMSTKNRFTKKIVPKTAPEEFEKFVYKCMDCMMGFKRRGMLVNHLAKRHPEKPPQQVPELNMPIVRPTRNYFCLYCERVYKSSSKRKSHILKSHPGKPVPPQLKGKDSVGGSEGEKLIAANVSVVTPTPSELKSILASAPVVTKPKETVHQQVVSTVTNEKVENGLISEQLKSVSPQQFREVSVVGKVMANPHACQWCHRQYATRAKLLQHQRKSHLHLMPPDMQLPRTQKNNVNRTSREVGRHNTSKNIHVVSTSHLGAKSDGKVTKKPHIRVSKISAAPKRPTLAVKPCSGALSNADVTPDSSTPTSDPKTTTTIVAVDSSTTAGKDIIQQAAASTTSTTITLNEHQLQQLQLHSSVGGASGEETGNVIGFLLTTTTLNANGELSSLVPSEIVVVPVNSHQLQQQNPSLISAATANAIQQAVLSTTSGTALPATSSAQTNSSSVLPLSTINSNILTNVISSAVNGVNIVNPN